jgi:uncharacterized protein (DUF169 family)
LMTDPQYSLQNLLGTTAEPIAIRFFDSPPPGIPRVSTAAPAGCAYWKLAAEGELFYTETADHLNCPIGAYTHGAELAPDVQEQLQGTIETMVGLRYLRMEEVAGIPRREQPLRVVVYSPLSRAIGTPDVVLVRGNARQIMLLVEAAQSYGPLAPIPVMGRPACSVIAASINTGRAATSLGCIGNRVYTKLPDGEFYTAIPGSSVAETVEALHTILAANAELERYHRGQCALAGAAA